jgi:hypothetical protein
MTSRRNNLWARPYVGIKQRVLDYLEWRGGSAPLPDLMYALDGYGEDFLITRDDPTIFPRQFYALSAAFFNALEQLGDEGSLLPLEHDLIVKTAPKEGAIR